MRPIEFRQPMLCECGCRQFRVILWDSDLRSWTMASVPPAYCPEGHLFRDWANLEQYIGLRDCKRTEDYPEGQKIWEGDCCRIGGGIFVVVWDGFASRFYLKSTKSVICKDIRYVRKATVIGSIHQNPELLKVKD